MACALGGGKCEGEWSGRPVQGQRPLGAAEHGVDGRDPGRQDDPLVIGAELSCRLAQIAPGMFHRNGFHPTAVFGVFGAIYAAARLRSLPKRFERRTRTEHDDIEDLIRETEKGFRPRRDAALPRSRGRNDSGLAPDLSRYDDRHRQANARRAGPCAASPDRCRGLQRLDPARLPAQRQVRLSPALRTLQRLHPGAHPGRAIRPPSRCASRTG